MFVPPFFPRTALACAVLLATVLGGCAIHEPPTKVSIASPAQWVDAPATPAADISPEWWSAFGSAHLATLVQQALAANPDLRTASNRVRQADLALRQAGVSLLPSASASAGSSTSRSEGGSTRKSSSASVGVSYEVDLWGRLAAGQDSARLAAQASRWDMETARITVVASVANSYFQWLTARARLAIAEENLAISERVLKITEARHRNGVATALDVSQQTTAVLQQRTALAPLQLQARQTASALALLLGEQPVGYAAQLAASHEKGETLLQLQVPGVTPGLPSTLLTRRPDLRAQETRLAAADADVAAARAALLPSLSLSTSGGMSSAALLQLSSGTGSLSLGASLAQTLFDGGRKKMQIESIRLQREMLVDNYATAARNAFKEVDDALGQAATSARQELAQTEVAAQAERTLRLAEVRYKEGVDSLLAVLDAQRTLFSARDNLTQQRLNRLNAAVSLYRVLGGGWQQEPSVQATQDTSQGVS